MLSHSKHYFSLIFVELREICPLKPHQNSALDLLRGAPRQPTKTDVTKFLFGPTLRITVASAVGN